MHTAESLSSKQLASPSRIDRCSQWHPAHRKHCLAGLATELNIIPGQVLYVWIVGSQPDLIDPHATNRSKCWRLRYVGTGLGHPRPRHMRSNYGRGTCEAQLFSGWLSDMTCHVSCCISFSTRINIGKCHVSCCISFISTRIHIGKLDWALSFHQHCLKASRYCNHMHFGEVQDQHTQVFLCSSLASRKHSKTLSAPTLKVQGPIHPHH